MWYNVSMNKLKRQMRKIIFYLRNFFLPTEFNSNLPYSLRPKSLAFVVVLALIIKSLSFVSWFALSDQPFFADITSGLVVYLSNQERQQAGLSMLQESQILDQAALDKALDMLAKNYFSHNSPDGTSPWFWFNKNGYAYKYAGENLAIDFYESKDVVNAWMDSSTHKFNILNNNYQETGVAVVKGSLQGRETTLVVQLFGTPKIKLVQGPPSQMGISTSPSPAVSVSVSVRPSPTVSPVVAGEGTVVSPTPTPTLEPTTTPTFAGLGTENQPPLNHPALTEKLVDLSADPSPVLFGLAGYLALSLLLGVFTKIYTPYPKAVFGAGVAMGLVILINYLPGVETALNLTTRIL